MNEKTVKLFIATSKKGQYLQKLSKSILNPLLKTPKKNEEVYE